MHVSVHEHVFLRGSRILKYYCTVNLADVAVVSVEATSPILARIWLT